MVKHVILWVLKDEYQDEEKEEIKKGIKEGLEGLSGQIPGLLSITVNTEPLESSNCDLMLDSTFENEKALTRYSAHPLHVAVATGKVRPYVKTRMCIDYVENGK
ncbi:MAG: Dabb family protein [Lachnospiraceae bacterium]|nr:Dabb family protein [Lachnospiraceae bacterium]